MFRALLTTASVIVAVVACSEVGSEGNGPFDEPIRPELTEFAETSSYADVMDYVRLAEAASPSLHLTTFGYSNEGRPLPLLVAGRVEGAGAESVRSLDLPVILLLGNIHAGEVAGKEALLRLLRRIANGEAEPWLDNVVLLIAPIYNADGNEKMDLGNRPRQHGPFGGMGTRSNVQGLNLNRDQMKLDAPEARSLAHLLNEYDPEVVVDLHTTNGTRHAYHLTYSPPLHPATPGAIDALLRAELLPEVTERVEGEYGWHFWHYGNVATRDGVPGWYTFDHRPRFVTNYAGLRNRIGILSEAYSYASFEDRILATERFVDEIVEWVGEHADRVRSVVREADALDLPGTSLPVRAGFPTEGEPTTILMGDVVEAPHPWTGQPVLLRTDDVLPQEMPAFIHFEGTLTEEVPAAYLVPADQRQVLDRLRAHGIRMETEAGPTGSAQAFRVDAVDVSETLFEGRNEVQLEGRWMEPALVPGGEALLGVEHVRVPMDQPLARLAFLLLEPLADDGFLYWGIFEGYAVGEPFPLLRVPVDR
ncbi:MAG: M14 family metallopeptidase [Gemmatimonadota bacterium]